MGVAGLLQPHKVPAFLVLVKHLLPPELRLALALSGKPR
jgi:hypothetical protein